MIVMYTPWVTHVTSSYDAYDAQKSQSWRYMPNTFGHLFRITTFGESHGEGLGVLIDGCPAGLSLSMERIQSSLDRRKPGQSHWTTSRKESDTVHCISGTENGITLGTPIMLLIHNENKKPKD